MEFLQTIFGLALFYGSTALAGKANFAGHQLEANTKLDFSYHLGTKETVHKSLCSLHCSRDTSCNGFMVADEQCHLFSALSVKASPGAPPSTYFMISFILLLRHNGLKGDLFPKFADDWALNKDNPESLLFSRMDELDNFKGPDGVYNFKLCYPDLPGDEKCFVFDQTSDPRTPDAPTGLVVYSTPPQFQEDCADFQGLLADSGHKAWLDGRVGGAYWTMALGASFESSTPASVGNVGYFPGPACKTDATLDFHRGHVELFVKTK